MTGQPTRPTFTAENEHNIEWLIPSDAADYLDPRPRQARYTSPVVIPGGVDVEMNSPTAVHKPRLPAPA